MRRSVLGLLCLSACSVREADFDEAYLEAWCEAWELSCEGAPAAGTCVATGRPVSVTPPTGLATSLPTTNILARPLEGCTYRPARAGDCLQIDAWSCEEDDAGQRRRVVPPRACEDVWTCD